MNNKHNNKSQNQGTEKLKEIPKWTRKYTQNRTLTVLVLTAMAGLYGILFALLVAFPLILTAAGFKKGSTILVCVGIAVFVAVLIAIVKFYIFMFAKFGGKNKGSLDQIIDRWMYGQEGFTSMPQPKLSKKRKFLDIFAGILYMICLIGSMELGMLGYIPVKYLLPFMALFVVPFGVYQYFVLRPRLGPVLLIFPILYAIHAILIIAGVPIYFTGTFAVPLNMFLPIIYNLLAFMVGHIYSRYALKKLKGLTHLEGDTANGD